MGSMWKSDMFRREGNSGYHSFYARLKDHYVCIFRRKGYQADHEMRLHNGHYIFGISISNISWNLKVCATFIKVIKWCKSRMNVIYCAFESLEVILLNYEILGTIWVPFGYHVMAVYRFRRKEIMINYAFMGSLQPYVCVHMVPQWYPKFYDVKIWYWGF